MPLKNSFSTRWWVMTTSWEDTAGRADQDRPGPWVSWILNGQMHVQPPSK